MNERRAVAQEAQYQNRRKSKRVPQDEVIGTDDGSSEVASPSPDPSEVAYEEP
jgi:hypothetical protein